MVFFTLLDVGSVGRATAEGVILHVEDCPSRVLLKQLAEELFTGDRDSLPGGARLGDAGAVLQLSNRNIVCTLRACVKVVAGVLRASKSGAPDERELLLALSATFDEAPAGFTPDLAVHYHAFVDADGVVQIGAAFFDADHLGFFCFVLHCVLSAAGEGAVRTGSGGEVDRLAALLGYFVNLLGLSSSAHQINTGGDLYLKARSASQSGRRAPTSGLFRLSKRSWNSGGTTRRRTSSSVGTGLRASNSRAGQTSSQAASRRSIRSATACKPR